jgi:mycothiol synthase
MSLKTRHDPPTIIRNYHPDDLERLRKLKIELEKRGSSLNPWFLQDLEESLALSHRLSELNAFVAQMKENLIAFLKLKLEMDIERVVLTLVVHPGHRKKSLLLRLIQRAITRARELEAERVLINLQRRPPELKNALLEMGFLSTRKYLELRLDLSKVFIPKTSRKGVHIRPFKSGEEDRLACIQNRAFGGMWGYSSNTIQDIIDRTTLPIFSPQDVLFAFRGKTLLGFCWTMIPPSSRFSYGSSGRIFMIGVDPKYHGRGFGKHLLLAGLSYLKGKGGRMIDLTVDSENRAALALYRSVGFRHRTSTLWYEMSLV